MPAPKAVTLLSGGLDSTTTLAIAKSEGYALYALSFDYGQRHQIELIAAQRVASIVGVLEHRIVPINLRMFGGSALTANIPVPKGRDPREMKKDIPVTYVPARNTIFLSFALAWAEVIGAKTIFLGVNALDYSGYPDCRPEYIEAFERMANLATKTSTEQGSFISIRTPLIHLTKEGIIQWGLRLGLDYSVTSSCYDPAPTGEACGTCDSCLLRLKGFEHSGVQDPIIYQEKPLVV